MNFQSWKKKYIYLWFFGGEGEPTEKYPVNTKWYLLWLEVVMLFLDEDTWWPPVQVDFNILCDGFFLQPQYILADNYLMSIYIFKGRCWCLCGTIGYRAIYQLYHNIYLQYNKTWVRHEYILTDSLFSLSLLLNRFSSASLFRREHLHVFIYHLTFLLMESIFNHSSFSVYT